MRLINGAVFFIIFGLPGIVVARGATTSAAEDVAKLIDYVGAWYTNFILPIGVILAGIMIAIGGIIYAASSGDPTKANTGKEYVFGAITGLILLLSVFFIIRVLG